MRRARLRGIFLFFVAAALICAAWYQWSPSVTLSPLPRQMHAVSEITIKIRQYDLDHPALETDDLKTKSIDDLVAMNVLTVDDAAYLREHDVTFYGYDPNHNVPVFDTIYKRGKTRKRITCYSKSGLSVSPIEPAK